MSDSIENDPTRVGSDGGAVSDPVLPKRIGQYSVRRQIASGGMGTVYEAMQEEPRRVVAVKVMRRGMNSPEALRRFHFEAQLLARLRHPGIAQVFEAGTCTDGADEIPFIAMEYISGAKTITEYVQEKHLGLRERLELFVQVCEAVHHGHQKGIVHRDLKPGNILVDSSGRPQVIDFGVARATDSDLAQTAQQTQMGELVGSLPYMSPEQFEADPHNIDTRSDIYSLGVVLYQLLSGRHPHELAASKIHELSRLVLEGSPRKLGEIDQALKGEVEAIVHKALDRDRDLRYQSAFGLAEDVRRYLSGEAVEARPQTLRYQLQIFGRRNRSVLVAMAALAVVLVGGVIATTTLYLRGQVAQENSEREQVRAQAEADRAQAAVQFLQETLTAGVPSRYGEEPTIRDMLDRASAKVGEALIGQPEVEAAIRRTLADGYFTLLDIRRAADEATAALAIYERTLGQDDSISVELAYEARFYCSALGRHDEELSIAENLVETLTRTRGPEHRGTLDARASFASALEGAGRVEEAEAIIRDVVAVSRRVLGDEDPLTVDATGQHVWLLLESGQDAEAMVEARRAFDAALEIPDGDSDTVRAARSSLAAVHIVRGELQEAERLYDREVPEDIGIEKVFQGNVDMRSPGIKLLVFWETWCPFSIRAVPGLDTVYKTYRSSGLEVLGLTRITRSSTEARVEEFIEEKGLSFTVAKEDGRAWTWFNCRGTPWVTVVRDGKIIWENDISTVDAISDRMLRALVKEG